MGENLKETTKINPLNIADPRRAVYSCGSDSRLSMGAEGYAAFAGADEGEHLGYFR